MRARKFWDDLAISSYSFRLRRTCFCEPIRLSGVVLVRDGKVVSVKDVFDEFPSKPIDNPELWAFKSIEQLFDDVLRAESQAAKLKVEYDLDIGYPKSIAIDWSERTIDNEIEYDIREFRTEN